MVKSMCSRGPRRQAPAIDRSVLLSVGLMSAVYDALVPASMDPMRKALAGAAGASAMREHLRRRRR